MGRPTKYIGIGHSMQKKFTLDYAQTCYKTIAMFANDGSACFDRMVPGVSSLIAKKFGIDSKIMECRNGVIKTLRRNVRTVRGDLEMVYKNSDQDAPLNVEVQGKGDVASFWYLKSHTILNSHEN